MSAVRLLFAAAALSFCLPLSAATRVYDVDPAYRQEVMSVLMRLLDVPNDPARSGKVEILPNGQLVVDTASDERQDEVAAILASIARNRPAETPSVSLRYWLIGSDPDAGTAPPPILSGVLSELAAVHGPQTFRVLASATVTGRAGDGAYYANPPWVIDQTANVNNERLNAEIYVGINILSGSGENEFIVLGGNPAQRALDVEVSFAPGQFLVLGSGSAPGTQKDGLSAIVVQWPGVE